MKRRNDDIWQMVAAEYALGTLAGPARRRFERLREADAYYCTMADTWERRFGTVVEGLPPVEPSPDLWERLSAAIDVEP
jgi:anti-sigma-K factor RskA